MVTLYEFKGISVDQLKTEIGSEERIQPLFYAVLLKAMEVSEDPEVPWKFKGIASDESADLEGDKILRKAIDLSYAQQRGYVNWDHSRAPEDQLGYLTQAEVIPMSRVAELKKNFPAIKDSASIYVEGQLYKGISRAQNVFNIMKSMPENGGGLGLSLDGQLARDAKSGGIVRAYVRGVAITPQPTHPNTLLSLKKSIAFYNELDSSMVASLPAEVAREVIEQLSALKKSSKQPLDHDEAVMFVMKTRPYWTYDLAKKIVEHTMRSQK